jgi:hypothetical protein
MTFHLIFISAMALFVIGMRLRAGLSPLHPGLLLVAAFEGGRLLPW